MNHHPTTITIWRSLAGLLVGPLLCYSSDHGGTNNVPDARELRAVQIATNLPGSPPATGIRYWKHAFQRLPLHGAYASVTEAEREGRHVLELWANTWGDGGAADRRIVVCRGPALDRMGEEETVCAGTLINDVPDPKNPAQLSPLRGYTRPAMTWDREQGYVLMACVCPDYVAPLYPAILVSSNGLPGSFQYLGKIKGEPEREAVKSGWFWSDGGSLLRLADGRWRMYFNGFGQVLAAAESGTLTGEWTFLRDGNGNIQELFPDFPKGPNYGGCFPTVLRVAEDNWHAWISDTWPPQAIWHFQSPDGLRWKPFGKQPEITRAAVGGRDIKCMPRLHGPTNRRDRRSALCLDGKCGGSHRMDPARKSDARRLKQRILCRC